MLKYEIKLTDDSIKQEELVWSEKYLAPDLSFVTGVTSPSYHLEKFNRLPLTNNLVNNTNSIALLETENVTRQGYAFISGKTYDVGSGTVIDYSIESSGTPIDYKYLFLNGKYYYSYKLGDGSYSGFSITNWLVPDENGKVTEEDLIVSATTDASGNTYVKLNTVAWIEDGIVTIDGYDYFYENDVQTSPDTNGCLKYYEDGDCLDYSAITECDSITCYVYKSATDCVDVTKFKLTKQEEINEEFDRVSHCKRFFYVKYKNYYLPIRLSGTTFICEVPNYVLGKITEPADAEYYKTEPYEVYYDVDETETQLSGESFTTLTTNTSYVKIDGGRFFIEYDVMNANSGSELAVYLTNVATNISIGDRIVFVDASEDNHRQIVYPISDYNFNSGDTSFVMFNGVKYKVEKNICDKVMINDHEYLIDYNNGKVASADCLVVIGDEKVPMKISGTTNGAYSAGTLTRYGKIISGDSKSAITANYDIVPYSGITVNNDRYIIKEEVIDKDNIIKYYAYLDRRNEYPFIVEDIMGSSMVICKPDINSTDFTEDFNEMASQEMCAEVVENQYNMILYTKNKIFGDKEITQELAFQNRQNPLSSDDYYDLFQHLVVFAKNGYIHIPLALSNSQGNNMLQDDIVESQFFNEVKKMSINDIVDMEKDVYLPKFMDGDRYNGSDTIFKSIKEIRVNLHFRTRNLDGWKVNEGYNDVSTSGISDNWFVTDYHPYRDMLATSGETLMKTSDLVGLLYFSNDDVFYQKSNIAKSFIRFSFYDSTNSQTQSLLATSCAFMDEHRLFKRFIDNSRKNVYDFGYVAEPTDSNGVVANKISVNTEYLGTRLDNKGRYKDPENRYTTSFSGTIMDDSHRLGSELIIDNKYETDTSSEGYYLYIFREYSENLTPKPIYMKVEFNHAGVGRTIPFIIPMKWTEPDENSGDKYPISALTLANNADVTELKEGIHLADVYAQTYIPLYAVYDFKNKEYAYVFDSRYVTVEDDTINLNLFELKIMDENTSTEEDQRDITQKRQERAVININSLQFDDQEKECGQ